MVKNQIVVATMDKGEDMAGNREALYLLVNDKYGAAAPVGITLRSHEAKEGYGKNDGAKQAPLLLQQLRYAAMMICK